MSQLATNNLILYSTSFCHLCKEAEQLLKQANKEWRCFEITDDESILNRYSLKIPVLLNTNTQQEICWPFTLIDIQALTE